jgi:ATP-dependent protease HslVU (ClpYQ) peptidase subunit
MSIVVAVTKAGRTAMAADTQSNFGQEVIPGDNQTSRKVRRVGDSLLGRTGWSVYENILDDLLSKEQPELGDASSIFRFFTRLWKVLHKDYAFVNDQSTRKDTPFGDLGGSFLVANRGGLYYVSPNLGVARFQKYYAIGAGADYSLGALHQVYDTDADAPALARRAVESAAAFSAQCGGAIEVHEVP